MSEATDDLLAFLTSLNLGTRVRYTDTRDNETKIAVVGEMYDGEYAFASGTEVFRPRAFLSIVGTSGVDVIDPKDL